jgi:plasmid stability protein
MADLTIHDFPDDAFATLVARAARSGRTVNEEVLAILARLADEPRLEGEGEKPAACDPDAAAEHLRELVRQANGGLEPGDSVDQFLADRRVEAALEELDVSKQVAEHLRWRASA